MGVDEPADSEHLSPLLAEGNILQFIFKIYFNLNCFKLSEVFKRKLWPEKKPKRTQNDPFMESKKDK